MAMKMKKKQKTGTGALMASHPRENMNSKGNRERAAKSPQNSLSGISRSFSGLLDRTRAYFLRAEPAEG
jgi:hypothetical protein